jgi:Zn-finger nucleic acid-binding protein
VRVCPHCDVKLDTVRCRRCFTLQQPGTFACSRCGQAMELEPLLDATDAPCPRCSVTGDGRHAAGLDATDEADFRLHECARCGGIFVPKDALAEILCRAEIGGAVDEPRLAPRANHLEEVRYLPCPLCHGSMNRVNFGRVSGVIVDVCKIHGTWFDAGELTRVVAFAASGGLEKTREREKTEREVARKESREIHGAFVAMEARQEMESRLGLWRDLLQAILFW